MRKRVVGATVVLTAGLALSGCAAGSGQSPASPEPQINGQSVEAGEQTATGEQTEDSGDNGRSDEDRPCTGRDLTAQYQSGEASPAGGEGTLLVTKKDASDPCVLDRYPDLRVLDGNGQPLETTVQHTLEPAPSRVPMPGPAYDQAVLSLKWTTAEGCGSSSSELALNLVGSDDWADALQVAVNTGEQDVFGSLCAGSTVDVSAFGAGVS
ncbi:tRNA pseudouridine55 synthase [Saccharopolyspora antimicrobica]|uniref:tRNA pseudouridine55 synthase n=1 Tax=Saccharopolyspora antimicrobica TaxID=455193 RepID=A0A1I4STL0_9PSEU|nr:DUF4232 domain-containing protein [Saccharopolyspora antimicrobica]RKT86007.1 tRNA pseudouridine55 synthase [Saccharopolyspora antimicrobica]SFM67826.1 tRNA pseudouridine55 synthase [Saccharopolyspora antimicrobica]